MPEVVTCLLENNGKILILKRSNKVKTYKGLWGGVAGYIEQDEDPFITSIKEIKEEVGLEKNEIKFIKKSEPIFFNDDYNGKKYHWIIHPFLYSVENKNKIKIDWENSEFKWINPSDIVNFNTVPHFKEIVNNFFK